MERFPLKTIFNYSILTIIFCTFIGNKMKEVLFVIESAFPFFAGGIENWLYNVVRILNDKMKIIVLSESPVEFKTAMYKLPDNVEFVNYHSIRSWGKMRFLLRGILGIIDYRTQKYFMRRQIGKILKRNNLDAIIALNTLNASSAVLSFKTKYPHIKYISCARTMHAEFASSYYPPFRNYFFSQEKKNMLNADEVWSNGYDTQEYYRHLGIESIVMKNGVDYDLFAEKKTITPYKNAKVIVSIGTLSEVKGYSYLMRAYARIKPKHQDAVLYLLGKGDPSFYRNLAKELNISDSVYFEGHQKDVAKYLQNATVCACLSGGSGLAMAAIEAMASGVPIVAWDTPVYQQFNIKTKTMELTPLNDIDSLSKKLDAVLSDPSVFIQMSYEARELAKEFDWNIICGDILKYINK